MIKYIWEKFTQAWFDEQTLELSRDIRNLSNARNHRPFDPSSKQHHDLCRKQLNEIHKLTENHPYLDLSELEDYFNASLKDS